MKAEQAINQFLNNYPGIKKYIKRPYQLLMYSISPKKKSEGMIARVSPNDNYEYFFGYYDKSPWDASGRYMLCMRARNTWTDVAPSDPADIILIDYKNNFESRVVATTHSWNVQQGCMAQWLGPDFEDTIIYNDFREGNYCSVVLNVFTGEERVINKPIYAVARDGKTALTLDFSRLHRLRKGYGYSNLPDTTQKEKLPDTTCIWKINIERGDVAPILKYTDLTSFQTREEMIKGEHKVNHIMINPSGTRFMMLHKWFVGPRKYCRLTTCNIDGTDLYALNDGYGASHCYWKNDNEIIGYSQWEDELPGYYLMKDKTQEFVHLWPKLCNDGHPSYCPTDNSLVVFDTYPDRARIQEVKIARDTDVEGKDIKVLARVFAPFKYDNDTRCDLHPRWSRDGKKICFDSVFEGHRGLYVVKL